MDENSVVSTSFCALAILDSIEIDFIIPMNEVKEFNAADPSNNCRTHINHRHKQVHVSSKCVSDLTTSEWTYGRLYFFCEWARYAFMRSAWFVTHKTTSNFLLFSTVAYL
jgi:hypothetical protein